METEKIRDSIRRYRLMPQLLKRLSVVINGGVARSTVYSAFESGPTTPIRDQIFITAKALIEQHEDLAKSLIQAEN